MLNKYLLKEYLYLFENYPKEQLTYCHYIKIKVGLTLASSLPPGDHSAAHLKVLLVRLQVNTATSNYLKDEVGVT